MRLRSLQCLRLLDRAVCICCSPSGRRLSGSARYDCGRVFCIYAPDSGRLGLRRGFVLAMVQPHYLSRTGRVQVPTRGDFSFAQLGRDAAPRPDHQGRARARPLAAHSGRDLDPAPPAPRFRLGLLELPPGDLLNHPRPSRLASAGRLRLCGGCGRLLIGCCDSRRGLFTFLHFGNSSTLTLRAPARVSIIVSVGSCRACG